MGGAGVELAKQCTVSNPQNFERVDCAPSIDVGRPRSKVTEQFLDGTSARHGLFDVIKLDEN